MKKSCYHSVGISNFQRVQECSTPLWSSMLYSVCYSERDMCFCLIRFPAGDDSMKQYKVFLITRGFQCMQSMKHVPNIHVHIVQWYTVCYNTHTCMCVVAHRVCMCVVAHRVPLYNVRSREVVMFTLEIWTSSDWSGLPQEVVQYFVDWFHF